MCCRTGRSLGEGKLQDELAGQEHIRHMRAETDHARGEVVVGCAQLSWILDA